MADLHITSTSNPRLKELVALRRRRARDESGTTLLEGTEELLLALEAGVTPFAGSGSSQTSSAPVSAAIPSAT